MSGMNEVTLLHAKGMDVRVGPRRRTEECVCGGSITAEIGWEAAAVDEHNATAIHQAWRAWKEAREAGE